MSFEKETLQKADDDEASRRRANDRNGSFDKKLVSLSLLLGMQILIGTVCLTYRGCDEPVNRRPVNRREPQARTLAKAGCYEGKKPVLTTAEKPPNSETSLIIIHIVGSVRKPGWFTFEPGARVIDAVTAAGGALPNTDFSDVNLARPLKDEEKLVFARK